MSDQYIGEIRMFAGNFAPVGWALCQGQLIAISQNTALFSLLGTTYGGNGTSTFALPDLQGRAPMAFGATSDPVLGNVSMGQQSGAEAVAISVSQLPAHTHGWPVQTASGSAGEEKGGTPTEPLANGPPGYATGTPDSTLAATTIGAAGGASQAHGNMMPYAVINFIIAISGIFPPRS
jgi:microcystin-dependent protein